MKKIILIATIFMGICANVVLAGQLGHNEYGQFYVQDDGSLAKSKWVTIDLDGDNQKEYYYFNEAVKNYNDVEKAVNEYENVSKEYEAANKELQEYNAIAQDYNMSDYGEGNEMNYGGMDDFSMYE